ncbi:DNA-binding protein [Halobacteria archaeon AArc-m2/3/4]|uniref:DNA-binding protein n=1 Tax=Natronoglomus mannanivorans TaxID=2979990 RepID=A0ABT2QJ73_9EURY|nr:DNA-binding protein [Halobacteria archaeon AArc-m2/3/4]
MRRSVRIALAFFLCVALVGLGVHYAESYDDRWPYPTENELDDDYAAHVGEDALVFGQVTAIDTAAGELTLESETDDGTRIELVADTVPTDGSEPAVEEGGFVQVYGTLEPDGEITTTETVVVNPNSGAESYKLAVSAIALLAGMGYFLVHWRPTLTGWEVRRG